MDVNRVLFISQEIAPYLPETPQSVMGRDLPQAMQQEENIQVRTFMPKYSFINERRNQLHEVIRISGKNIVIDDTDHPLIIKVATLQPARMQVYFIYNEDYFMRRISKELETISHPEDNDERSIFFVRGSLETVRELRWVPDVIHCTGWVAALAPLYIKKYYADDPSFRDSKIVYSLFDEEFPAPFNEHLHDKLKQDGFKDKDIKQLAGKQADFMDLARLALQHSDGVMQCSQNVKPEVMDLVKASGLPFLPYADGITTDAKTVTEFYKSL